MTGDIPFMQYCRERCNIERIRHAHIQEGAGYHGRAHDESEGVGVDVAFGAAMSERIANGVVLILQAKQRKSSPVRTNACPALERM
jgi:hypothetical protein